MIFHLLRFGNRGPTWTIDLVVMPFFIGGKIEPLRQCIGHLRPMCTPVDPSLFCLLNIDTGNERCRPRNTLESSPSPNPRHLAFAFAFHSSASNLYVCEVLVFMGLDDADARLWSLLSLTDMEYSLTVHFALMDLRRCRADRKMLREDDSGNCTSKDSVPIAKIIDDTLSRPAHSRMARFDGFCLGSAEEPHAHDEEGDCRNDGLSELHDYSLHNRWRRRSRMGGRDRAPLRKDPALPGEDRYSFCHCSA